MSERGTSTGRVKEEESESERRRRKGGVMYCEIGRLFDVMMTDKGFNEKGPGPSQNAQGPNAQRDEVEKEEEREKKGEMKKRIKNYE